MSRSYRSARLEGELQHLRRRHSRGYEPRYPFRPQRKQIDIWRWRLRMPASQELWLRRRSELGAKWCIEAALRGTRLAASQQCSFNSYLGPSRPRALVAQLIS